MLETAEVGCFNNDPKQAIIDFVNRLKKDVIVYINIDICFKI